MDSLDGYYIRVESDSKANIFLAGADGIESGTLYASGTLDLSGDMRQHFQDHIHVALAEAMSDSIRRNLNYFGFARSILDVQQIGEGALPVYSNRIPEDCEELFTGADDFLDE